MGRMIYVIDGHNLIPHIPGLSLSTLDDEMRLVGLLQVYSRVRRHRVEVFFDGAPPGQSGSRSLGTVKAHFVRAGRTADDAIRAYLRRLKPDAARVTVVTSDRQVRAEAHALRANLLDSAAFAADLLSVQQEDPAGEEKTAGPSADPAEVDEWLKLFGGQ
jgi:predicted RNA-binding protein with PIN domain